MAQRPYDSSLTRVAPAFDALRDRDPTGLTWLAGLLDLPRFGHPEATVPATGTCTLTAAHWGANEKPLQPPVSLLSWLVRNLPVTPPERGSEATQRRLQLHRRDYATIAEGLMLLRSDPSPRGWWVLEGETYPDVYLETEAIVVVIEGKRTEPGPTTRTTWMPGRHQMLRHLDAAWEIRGARPVAGFFVVEGAGDPPGTEVPQLWRDAAHDTWSEEAIASSLPHRPTAERDAIARSFLGATTWQAICEALQIPRSCLIDRL